jgi:hypothetical protein
MAAPEAVTSGNGSHADSTSAASLPERAPHESAAAREYHAEGREQTPHEPIAHFEPTPKPDTAAAPSKPYVVWSSAPPQKESESRGPEE